MTLSLTSPLRQRLRRLVPVDMAPRQAPLSTSFAAYIDCMLVIQAHGVRTKSEADLMMKDVIPVRHPFDP